MSKTLNHELVIRVTPKDNILCRWFELAGIKNKNRSRIILLTVKYYMLAGELPIIANVHTLDREEEKVSLKRLYRAPEFEDVYKWLKSETSRPSSLVKKILANSISNDNTKEEYILDEFQIFQKISSFDKLARDNKTMDNTTSTSPTPPPKPDNYVDIPKPEPEKQKENKPQQRGDALLKALLPNGSGFKFN